MAICIHPQQLGEKPHLFDLGLLDLQSEDVTPLPERNSVPQRTALSVSGQLFYLDFGLLAAGFTDPFGFAVFGC